MLAVAAQGEAVFHLDLLPDRPQDARQPEPRLLFGARDDDGFVVAAHIIEHETDHPGHHEPDQAEIDDELDERESGTTDCGKWAHISGT